MSALTIAIVALCICVAISFWIGWMLGDEYRSRRPTPGEGQP